MAEFPSQAHPPRPQLLRGNTVPLYVRTSSGSQDLMRPQSELAAAYSAHPERYASIGQRQGDGCARRDQSACAAQIGASSSTRAGQNWQLPPTPSPGSAESYPDEAYFPSTCSVAQPPQQLQGAGVRHVKSHGGNYVPSPSSPTVATPTVTTSPASFQLLRSTRAPTPQSSSAQMRIDNTAAEYTLAAAIGPGFDSNCITIAARKGNILDIVADRWDLEKDCHHEWQVQFDRDADMSSVHAGYSNGVLTVTVKRLNYSCARPPQMRP
ncbi:hypothetical protein EW145_g1431 [Phellinidium pouzarii]|uniref:SHSP domain-containing protein n=1 Tax=Phellinidium pouzarii TaxID=167371 RepID=A0A4S4LK11_9AGAM|nr:hypothetical protein EW145_g1431 [Phellinidium pouzarii]